MKKIKGFTLVELLAVIVILAVIQIIAMPKISDAMFKYGYSNNNFTTIYIHDEKQKELDWGTFVNYEGCNTYYKKETGVVSSAFGDVKVVLR